MDTYTEQRVVMSVFFFFLDVVEAVYRLTGLISVEEIIAAFVIGLAAGVMVCAYISRNTTDDVKESNCKNIKDNFDCLWRYISLFLCNGNLWNKHKIMKRIYWKHSVLCFDTTI